MSKIILSKDKYKLLKDFKDLLYKIQWVEKEAKDRKIPTTLLNVDKLILDDIRDEIYSTLNAFNITGLEKHFNEQTKNNFKNNRNTHYNKKCNYTNKGER